MTQFIDPAISIGEVAAAHPAATRVFERHRLDYCCAGKRPFVRACEESGLEPQAVMAEVMDAELSSPSPEPSWEGRPSQELVDHIVATYHDHLREELPRLEALTAKVLEAHGDTNGPLLQDLHDTFVALRAELFDHMAKEEDAAFPMAVRGENGPLAELLAVLEEEHDGANEALGRLRAMTNAYSPPPNACPTWRSLYQGLAALEEMMHRHIHLENNVLFPQALAGPD